MIARNLFAGRARIATATCVPLVAALSLPALAEEPVLMEDMVVTAPLMGDPFTVLAGIEGVNAASCHRTQAVFSGDNFFFITRGDKIGHAAVAQNRNGVAVGYLNIVHLPAEQGAIIRRGVARV